MLRRALNYVDAIARAGSVRKAAERLNVATSAVNRQLLDLEAELGVALFERIPSGMRPTAAGELLLAYIRRQKRDFEAIRRQLEDLRGLRRGTVRIASHQSAARDIVPRAIAGFRTRFPRVDHEVRVADSDRIAAALVSDAVELGIVFNPPPNPLLRRVAEVRTTLCAIVAPDHPLVGRPAVRLSECLSFPLAMTPPTASATAGTGAGARVLVEAAAKELNASIEPALQTDSFELTARFVRESDGVFIQIAAAAAPEIRRGELVAIPLLDRGLDRGRLTLLARRDRALQPLPSYFAEALAAEMRSPPDPPGGARP